MARTAMPEPLTSPTLPLSRGRLDAYSAAESAALLARFYDLDVLDVAYDAELYLALAQQAGGDILELAVGSGRLAIPLALAGHRVLGIDHDPAMLRRARRRWDSVRGSLGRDRLRLRRGDMFDIHSQERFGLAFIAVNTFLLASDDDARLALLSSMRSLLHPGGLAVVEISTPDADELETFDGRLQLEWLRHDPESGDQVAKLVSVRHEPDADSLLLCQVYEWTPPHGGALHRVSRVDTLHLVSAVRLAALARDAGFASVDLRGDHLATPYASGSQRAILVARSV
jgi:SAM-dependent methyltransferase